MSDLCINPKWFNEHFPTKWRLQGIKKHIEVMGDQVEVLEKEGKNPYPHEPFTEAEFEAFKRIIKESEQRNDITAVAAFVRLMDYTMDRHGYASRRG